MFSENIRPSPALCRSGLGVFASFYLIFIALVADRKSIFLADLSDILFTFIYMARYLLICQESERVVAILEAAKPQDSYN